MKSDIVCTEFNPSEGSRSYVDGSSVEPAENNHIKSRLSSLSSQAWTPEVFTIGGYIEITINRPLSMRGIVTQGGSGKWVTEYEVWTSADGREDNYDPQGFFQGNVDDETKVSNVLPLPVSANFVRWLQIVKYKYVYFHFDFAEGQSPKMSLKYQNIGCIDVDFCDHGAFEFRQIPAKFCQQLVKFSQMFGNKNLAICV